MGGKNFFVIFVQFQFHWGRTMLKQIGQTISCTYLISNIVTLELPSAERDC